MNEIYIIKPVYKNSAFTLNPEYLGKHENGWIIMGNVIEDYYEWVNNFTAFNEITGQVIFGNFEERVFADSKTTYEDFIKLYPPEEWDYGDI